MNEYNGKRDGYTCNWDADVFWLVVYLRDVVMNNISTVRLGLRLREKSSFKMSDPWSVGWKYESRPAILKYSSGEPDPSIVPGVKTP